MRKTWLQSKAVGVLALVAVIFGVYVMVMETRYRQQENPGPVAEADDVYFNYRDDPAAAATAYGSREFRVRLRADEVQQYGGNLHITHHMMPGRSSPSVAAVVPIGGGSLQPRGQVVVRGRVRMATAHQVIVYGSVD